MKNQHLRPFRVHQQQPNQMRLYHLPPSPHLMANLQDIQPHKLNLRGSKLVKGERNWREVKNPSEIEFILRLRNQRHFGQAETDRTPFTQPPFKQQLNWRAGNNKAELVLEGDYKNDELDEMSKLLRDNLTRVTPLHSQQMFVTPSDMQEMFSKWK